MSRRSTVPASTIVGAQNPWGWALALLACAVLLRLALLMHYPAGIYPDTETYVQSAHDLVSGDYSIGQARRTPGYPALIVLAGFSVPALIGWQAAIGVLASLMLFLITLAATRRPALAFVVGLAHSLNLQQLYLEGTLLSESLSAASVVATLLALWLAMARQRADRPAAAAWLLTGVLGSFAFMVRPQFIFFVGMLPVLSMLAARAPGTGRPSRAAVVAATWVAAPMLVAVLAWSAVVQAKVGPFTLSTQSGFGLVNHVHDELEYAPDEFAVVRDILIRTRDARIAQVGNGFNTVWYGWPEVRRVTGWTLPQASDQFKRMSTAIIKRRPLQYVGTVSRAWVAYWTVPNLWDPDGISPAPLRNALQGLWWVEHKLLRLANLAFVLLVAAVTVSARLRRGLRWDIPLTALAATVLLSSLLQAVADHGSNSRYAMPTQSLVLLVLAVAAARWYAPAGAPPHSRHATATA